MRYCVVMGFPNNNFYLDRTKFKAVADDNFNFSKIMVSIFFQAENTVGKGENAGYQHFLLFRLSFPKSSSSGSLKVGTVW